MKSICKLVIMLITVFFTMSTIAAAASMDLKVVTFPESKTIKLNFHGARGIPGSALDAKVEFQKGQAQVEMHFQDMKPAVLFGGDVSCYVVWAVSRDGSFENLGELWMPNSKGKLEFSTGRKSFALLVTAESYVFVPSPSELVVLYNLAPVSKKAPTAGFEFTSLSKAPSHPLASIANIAWDSNRPLDLMQAEKAYELAGRLDAAAYVPNLVREAQTTLGQARTMASRKKMRLDYSRRSIALSSDAIRISLRSKEAEELEQQIARRRREMEQLELRARQSEEQSATALLALKQAKLGLSEAQKQQDMARLSMKETQAALQRMSTEKEVVEAEKQALELQKQGIVQENAEMLSSLESLRTERERLASRLKGALSQVAETRNSARGLIVNLPDILFDLNKATLKPETQIVIAKLAGILLMMPELKVGVEGYTDATGSDDYNLKLSRQRADAVSGFLEAQAIESSRLASTGYGESRPVASNDTAEGRRKNRRVEIIISRPEVDNPPPSLAQ